MEMITKKELELRRRLFAVAIFFGVGATTAQAAASQTEYIFSDNLPVVEMNFYDAGEFSSDYSFNEPMIFAARSSATYWQNLLGLQTNSTPWQIALTTSEQPIIDGKTFSFKQSTLIQDNYLAQMLQGKKILAAFDLQNLADEKIYSAQVQTFLQTKSPADDSALTVVTIGDNIGAIRSGTYHGWSVDENTILPTNEQVADLIGALRLELAHGLGAEVLLDSPRNFSNDLSDDAWILHLVDTNGNLASAGKQIVTGSNFGGSSASNYFVADRVYFVGKNVSRVLGGATFNGVSGIPINPWKGSEFDGVQTLIPGLMSALPYKNYSTFTELELAAMQDIGYSIDRKNFYGKSIYSSGDTVKNSRNFMSDEPLAVGLHVWGNRNDVTQSGNISLSGNGAVGVRVDGTGNRITIPFGTMINSDGLRGKGVLISYGREHNLKMDGEISASGNGVEFNFGSNMLGAAGEYRGSYMRYLRNVDTEGTIIGAVNLPLTMTNGVFNYSPNELDGALVNNFDLSGTIRGGDNAIYIGKNAFVKNINVNDGAKIMGNITSDWKHFTSADGFYSTGNISPIKIQYGDKLIDTTEYAPDLVTNLNINGNFDYGGNISGADNIKLNVNRGTMNIWGAADVVNVEIMRGARLFGTSFTLNDMTSRMAEGFEDRSTGKFINHGTIGAASADTNLVINGDLISDGFLQKVSGGSAGSIIVNGDANIEGSTVTTDSMLPNETATVLVAKSISGNISNPSDKPFPISAMLSATGAIVGNTLTVTTHDTSNLGGFNSQERETFGAMNNMYDKLEGNIHQEEMRDLYNLDPPDARRTLTEIGSNDSAKVMSVAQQNTAVDRMISDRITKVFSPDYIVSPEHIELNVHPMKLADGDDTAPEVKVKVKVPSRQENNFWINFMKNWGELRGGTDYHGSVIVAGYDRPFGRKWRAGMFATYGTIGYGAESSRAKVYDTRLGLYAGWHNRASDVYFYINGGQLRNSLHRGISSLGLSTNANYKSRIIEIGGEYKYDLSPKKIWHVSPFVNFQASYLKQNSYNESGAGVYNQHVASDSNTYFAAQAGLDLKRYYRNGMFGIKLGVKHGFTGADPDLRISYEGDTSTSYRLRQKRDKTHFVFSLRGDNEFARGWYIGGETEFQIGENDKDVTASITLRRMW